MDTNSPLQLREASLAELLWVHERIFEFPGKASLSFYQDRLQHRLSLALVAVWEGELAGFKVGYQSELPETFYSWMGGVRPEFRGKRIATALAEEQERWAKAQGFTSVFFKTRNRFPAMIQFGIKRGFKIVDLHPKGGIEDYRIVMHKNL
jgi:GNAT superfamily N-acetyltransferase|uniref:GNAT family N-acetyltransferase n=2 Tax=Algoriphagus sp. TaxID=1872435 RepID=UPI0040476598